jgi:hypothetical protein
VLSCLVGEPDVTVLVQYQQRISHVLENVLCGYGRRDVGQAMAPDGAGGQAYERQLG